MLVEFLHMDNRRIVTAMCSTLRNMALDDRNKQLIGKFTKLHFKKFYDKIILFTVFKNYIFINYIFLFVFAENCCRFEK